MALLIRCMKMIVRDFKTLVPDAKSVGGSFPRRASRDRSRLYMRIHT